MKLKVLELSEADRAKLAKGCSWGMHHRAHIWLNFGDGLLAKAIATQQGLQMKRVWKRTHIV
jgi:hypothetical protein